MYIYITYIRVRIYWPGQEKGWFDKLYFFIYNFFLQSFSWTLTCHVQREWMAGKRRIVKIFVAIIHFYFTLFVFFMLFSTLFSLQINTAYKIFILEVWIKLLFFKSIMFCYNIKTHVHLIKNIVFIRFRVKRRNYNRFTVLFNYTLVQSFTIY